MEQVTKTPATKASVTTPVTEIQERYAIFQTGGKQYQAVEGKTIAVEKLEGEAGDTLEFKEVLFRKTAEGTFEFGKPYLTT
ncbi:MAG: 50S ribosomal protein L21, partial [bacterium]|nr:50S ribosomal protein L21 [bacterium]